MMGVKALVCPPLFFVVLLFCSFAPFCDCFLAGEHQLHHLSPTLRRGQQPPRMAQDFEAITPELRDFVHQQPLFFVATAPTAPDGHVNLSPKGMQGTFRFLSDAAARRLLPPHHPTAAGAPEAGPHHPLAGPSKGLFCYLDLGGSGVETPAHLRENGRVTVMFCAFAGPPKILRLYGRGWCLEPGAPGWDDVLAEFPAEALARFPPEKLRNAVLVDVRRVRDSCGYGVPTVAVLGGEEGGEQGRAAAAAAGFVERRQFPARYAEWSAEEHWARRFSYGDGASLDGLPSLDRLGASAPGRGEGGGAGEGGGGR